MADGAASAWHAKVATVLGLVVHHCPMTFRDINRFLRISHTVHQELLRTQGQVCVDPSDRTGYGSMQNSSNRAAGLAQWLRRYAGLVGSLDLRVVHSVYSFDWNQASKLRSLQSWVAWALRSYRMAAAATATLAAAIQGPGAAAAPRTPTLRLRKVVVELAEPGRHRPTCEVDSMLLQELAALHTHELLTTCCLLPQHCKDAALLGRLTELQKLTCYDGLLEKALPHLPASLRVLRASIVQLENRRYRGQEVVASTWDLTHLKQLQELQLVPNIKLPSPTLDAALPQQLTRLVALTPLAALSGGEALQRVHLDWRNAGVLSCLVDLVGPWSLMLGTDEARGSRFGVEKQKQVALAAAAALSSCSGLTALFCIHDRSSYLPAVFRDVGWCAAVSALPQLQKLELWGLDLPSDDLLKLTALSSLRSLYLLHIDGCDSTVATSLASSLTGLTELILRCDSINSCAAGLLSVVGSKLAGLCVLMVAGGPEFVVRDAELLLLSGLTRLSRLALSPLRCSGACRKQLLAAVPGLCVVEGARHSTERPPLMQKYRCFHQV